MVAADITAIRSGQIHSFYQVTSAVFFEKSPKICGILWYLDLKNVPIQLLILACAHVHTHTVP